MPIDVTLIPGHSEIIDLLASHVTGPYRLVHDTREPWIRVEPLQGGIRITSSDRLRVHTDGDSLVTDAPIEFVVIFDIGGIRLAQRVVPSAAMIHATRPQCREIRLGTPTVDMMPEGGLSPAPRVARARQKIPPAPPLVPAPVVTPDLTIPEPWRAFCETHDLHPEQGDYVVLPVDQLDAYPPRPAWVATTPHITEVQVVKPREEGR